MGTGKMFQGGEEPVRRPRGGNSSKADTACVGCILLVRPLDALNFTKSPLVAGKMNKANPGPLPAEHPRLGVVLNCF